MDFSVIVMSMYVHKRVAVAYFYVNHIKINPLVVTRPH